MPDEKVKSLVYLAAPYSHDDPAVRQERFEKINEAASFLMRRGLRIFSPISHSHPIALAGGLPGDWEFWKGYDEEILSACRALVVLLLPGWDTSTGVREETKIATGMIPVSWTNCDETSLGRTADWLLREQAMAEAVGAEVRTVR